MTPPLKALGHVCLLLLCGAAFAAPVRFDIPAQPAPSALQLFMKQSGAQVMFLHDELKDVTGNEVKGDLEPVQALDRILSGTGFIGKQKSASNFTVVRIESEKPGSIEGQVRDESGKPVPGARVSVAGSENGTLTDRRGRFLLEDVPAGAQAVSIFAEGMQKTRVTDVVVRSGHRHTLSAITIPAVVAGITQLEDYIVSAKKNDGVIELDPYNVRGTRAQQYGEANVDIPRTINDAQAYYVFDSDSLENSGATNIEEFLKQRLTMNATAITNREVTGLIEGWRGNASSINLRGLGSDKTLVLVNGRRVAHVRVNDTDGQPDLNGIPMAAIDRIEILPSSASGIYGGSALGGVVNVILKRSYKGGEVRFTYDNTFATDSAKRSVAISYGTSLEGGRTHLLLTGSWSDMNELLIQDRRHLFDRGRNAILNNNPAYFFSSTSAITGSLPNIIAPFEPSLVLRNGSMSLNTRRTYVAPGTGPDGSGRDIGFIANSGQWNMEVPSTQQGLLKPFGAVPKVTSFSTSARRQFTPAVEVFIDLAYNSNKSSQLYNPMTSNLLILRGLAGNPFDNNVFVALPSSLAVPMSVNSRTQSATVGIVANVGQSWEVQADYTFSKNQFAYKYYGMEQTTGPTSFAADLASGAINLFVDTRQFTPNLAKYLFESKFDGEIAIDDFALRTNGSLSIWQWVSARVSAGIDYRVTNQPTARSYNTFRSTPAMDERYTIFAREQSVKSGYGEFYLPLAKPASFLLIESLEAQVAYRSDAYQVNGGTSGFVERGASSARTYLGRTNNGVPFFSTSDYSADSVTFGLKYQPLKDVTIRASRATGFLPPTPEQLVRGPGPDTSPTTVSDPKTGTSVSVVTWSGGNPNLTAQSSKSLNFGVIWEPHTFARGLRCNLEYYRIEQFDAIGSLSAQTVVNNERIYEGRVTRNATGAITQVDTSFVNLYERETEGWDLSASYLVESRVGTFNAHVTGSRIAKLTTQYSRDLPPFDAANFPAEGGALKTKVSGGLLWNWNKLSTGWTVSYFDSYRQRGAPGGPSSTQSGGGIGDARIIAAQGGYAIPSQIYHDAFFGYAFGKSSDAIRVGYARSSQWLLRDVDIKVGVRNVFDKAPPFDAFLGNAFSSTFGDPRMRSYWVSLRRRF